MKLSGTIEMSLDAVDMEQAGIEEREARGATLLTKSTVALRAAMDKPDFKTLQRVCGDHNHTIEYKDSSHDIYERKTRVRFIIRAKRPEEMAA